MASTGSAKQYHLVTDCANSCCHQSSSSSSSVVTAGRGVACHALPPPSQPHAPMPPHYASTWATGARIYVRIFQRAIQGRANAQLRNGRNAQSAEKKDKRLPRQNYRSGSKVKDGNIVPPALNVLGNYYFAFQYHQQNSHLALIIINTIHPSLMFVSGNIWQLWLGATSFKCLDLSLDSDLDPICQR